MSEVLIEAWNWLGPAQEFVLAILLSVVTTFVLFLFKPRVKLHWGSTSLSFHKFKLSEESEPIIISTEKMYVQNTGRKAASKIELILSDIPSSYTLWSPREHESKALKGGGFSITVPTLAPHELLIVDIIDVDVRNPKLIAVNCPDVIANKVAFQAQRVFGTPVYCFVVYLMLSGLIGTIYLGLKLFFD